MNPKTDAASLAESACAGGCATVHSIWQPRAYIPQLDGVRGLAILLVTLFRFSTELPTDGVVGNALAHSLQLGQRGVELFFVLSGFLITGILLDTRESRHYFRNFYARRTLRIFPLYLFAVFLFLFVFNRLQPWTGQFQPGAQNQFFVWTWLVNVKMSLEGNWCFGYLDHFWSLAVEEHFYLVWPLLVFFLPSRSLMRFSVALLGASTISRILFAMLSENTTAPEVFTFFRCDPLLMGSIIAMVARQESGLERIRKWLVPVSLGCLLIAVLSELTGKRMLTVPLTAWGVFWSGGLVWLLTRTPDNFAGTAFSLPWIRLLGKYSYAMYVFQKPLIPITAGFAAGLSLPSPFPDGTLSQGMFYLCGMTLLTFLISVVSWNLLEKHCLKLKKHFRYCPDERPREMVGTTVQTGNAAITVD